jgi:hypothetical protein
MAHVFEVRASLPSVIWRPLFPMSAMPWVAASRNQSPAQRAMNRADRIASRLHDMWKGTTKAKWEFPPKPSRMRWKTYRRLKQRYYELQGRWTSGVMARFGIKV